LTRLHEARKSREIALDVHAGEIARRVILAAVRPAVGWEGHGRVRRISDAAGAHPSARRTQLIHLLQYLHAGRVRPCLHLGLESIAADRFDDEVRSLGIGAAPAGERPIGFERGEGAQPGEQCIAVADGVGIDDFRGTEFRRELASITNRFDDDDS
jgi:hypothetical protein